MSYIEGMSRRDERQKAMVRLSTMSGDDGSFDRVFWMTVDPAKRVEAVWDMVLDYHFSWKKDGFERRLQRSVCRLEHRGR